METVLKMAGEFTSHAIWSVSEGEMLMPIVGYSNVDGSTKMERLAMGSVQALSHGDKQINSLGDDTLGACFIKDGLVTLETGKTDALVVDVRFSDSADKKIQFLIPYRNAKHADGFAVHRLKVVELEGIDPQEMDSLTSHFFDGLEEHEQGGKLWNEKYIDQAGVSTGFAGDESTDFSVEEFEVLKQAPFLIFFLVAASDGKVDKKEVVAFANLLSDPNKITNPLLIRIITNVINNTREMLADMATRKLDFVGELTKLGSVVDNNMPEAEANAFKVSLLSMAVEIAGASGGFLGFGSKISKEEKASIAGIALCLGIKPPS